MGYPILAIEYLDKAQLKDFDSFGMKYVFPLQKLIALNYSKIGKVDKAIDLINKYLEYIKKESENDKLRLGVIYLALGDVYQNAGDFEKALKNFEIASKNFDEEDEIYLECLCYKSSLLRTNNRNDEVKECLAKGLPMVAEGTLWYEWLYAIKHSLTLGEESSLMYMEWTAIPMLHKYGKHTVVMECCDWLGRHFIENRKYNPAWEYTSRARTIYRKLMEGDLSL